jgi:hypothetical protein
MSDEHYVLVHVKWPGSLEPDFLFDCGRDRSDRGPLSEEPRRVKIFRLVYERLDPRVQASFADAGCLILSIP